MNESGQLKKNEQALKQVEGTSKPEFDEVGEHVEVGPELKPGKKPSIRIHLD